jgi:hypothetical protein
MSLCYTARNLVTPGMDSLQACNAPVIEWIHFPMYTVDTTSEFDHWLMNIKDVKTRTRLARRLRQAECGNLGDIKNVGLGVFEMRDVRTDA